MTVRTQSAPARTEDPEGTRTIVARGFTWIEDIVYVGLGVLLSAGAIVLLVSGAVTFARELFQGSLPGATIGLLDRLLLTLMVVELLYTVQVSFREHALVPEPFLLVGLVAVIRRVLVVAAELGVQSTTDAAFRLAMIELGVLGGLILILVASLVMLKQRHPGAVATRA